MKSIQGQIEARREWQNFSVAIQKAQPATETFTKEALMLIHLMMGEDALRVPSPEPVASTRTSEGDLREVQKEKDKP